MPGAPAVEAENEFIEVGLEVLAAQPMIDAQGPDREVGKDPVDPGQHDVSGHLTDDMGIMGDAGGAGILNTSFSGTARFRGRARVMVRNIRRQPVAWTSA